jgi:hypothetical protein
MKFRYIFLLWIVGWAGLLGIAVAATSTYLEGAPYAEGEPAGAVASGPDCPAPSMRYDERSCFLNGQVHRDFTMTSDTRWVLTGKVTVGEDVGLGGDPEGGPTLTIEPGTRIVGMSGPDVLVVSRGAKIVAEGTRQAPIVMTTIGREGGRGQWGGLVINGLAPVNGCDEPPCELAGEGRSGLYGGDRPGDSSGVLRYVQVRHAGHRFTADNELNGIAFQGVGSGTRVDHVQVHNNADDGVEFFGGTVDVANLVLTGNADDSLDWTNGWRGTARNVLIRQTDTADRGIEGDNNGDAMDARPRSAPVLANLTILGSGAGSQAMLLREGSGAEVHNALIAGAFRNGCVDVDDPATVNAGEIRFRNSVIDCAGGPAFVQDARESWRVAEAIDWAGGDNRTAAVALAGIQPAAGSALREAPAHPPASQYVGAVGDVDWTRGWTYPAREGGLTAGR